MYICERVNYGKDRSGGTPKLFGRTVGVRTVQNGGQRNRQGGDVGQCTLLVNKDKYIMHILPFGKEIAQ